MLSRQGRQVWFHSCASDPPEKSGSEFDSISEIGSGTNPHEKSNPIKNRIRTMKKTGSCFVNLVI